MLDNLDIAVLTKLNELAERHGLKPYDFVATFRCADSERSRYALHFEMSASGTALREKRFDQMLGAIGIESADAAELTGSPVTIIDALDRALQTAPRPPGRF